MKIAQVVPIWESVPPEKYGGTQRVASLLTEGLVENGHDVTLFATGDSETKAKLVPGSPKALYREGVSWENHLYPALHYYNAFKEAENFDIIHCHIDRHTEYFALMLATYCPKPVVFTLHFHLPDSPDRQDRREFLEKFKALNYISISNSQRQPMPELNFVETVYNGIDTSAILFHEQPGDKLIWLGRMSKSKGAKEAIAIAEKAGRPLIMAGKLDTLNPADVDYFEKEIKPKVDGQTITYLGEVDSAGRDRLFSQALTLLNPIQWDEPFGLVPAEAMAAGVPVIANRRGAMSEIIVDKKTGFLVSTIDEAVEAILQVNQLNRGDCRKHIETNFSARKMIDHYQAVYQKLTT